MPPASAVSACPRKTPARRHRARLALIGLLAAGLAGGSGAALAEDGPLSLTGQIFRPLPEATAQAPLSFTWDDLAALIRLVPPTRPGGEAPAAATPGPAGPTLGDVLREAEWRKGVFPLVSMSSREQIEREIGPIPKRAARGNLRSWLSSRPAAGGGL